MRLTAVNDKTDPNSTGWSLLVDGVFQCFMLGLPHEFEGVPNVEDKCCILPGTYALEVSMSAHFKRPVPHILSVPGRTAVEIHPGNRPEDIKGCFCVGEDRAVDCVVGSQAAFDALMLKLIASNGPFTIDVIGGD